MRVVAVPARTAQATAARLQPGRGARPGGRRTRAACGSIEGLRRIRETPPQIARDEGLRRLNVAGSFAWHGSPLDGARLWLVDDVLTTGATLEAAGSALVAAGAGRIDAIVVAVVV